MISAPTRAPENHNLDRIKGFRIAGYSARADVGADIIRPRRHTKTQKAVRERNTFPNSLLNPLLRVRCGN